MTSSSLHQVVAIWLQNFKQTFHLFTIVLFGVVWVTTHSSWPSVRVRTEKSSASPCGSSRLSLFTISFITSDSKEATITHHDITSCRVCILQVLGLWSWYKHLLYINWRYFPSQQYTVHAVHMAGWEFTCMCKGWQQVRKAFTVVCV